MEHFKQVFFLTSILIYTSFSSPLFAQDDDFIKEYLERMENSKKYLIDIAETMPEDRYDYKATQDSMSFEENLMHIAWAMDWHAQSLMGGRKARDWNNDTELKIGNKSKK